jgi:hypothetical protein
VVRFIPVDQFRRFWVEFKYPKFVLLIFTFVLAYMLFSGSELAWFREQVTALGYVGSFLAGVFYAYGFTAAPATGVFLLLAKHQNIWLAGILAGFGALLADLVIFKFIRSSFSDEIEHLANEPLTQYFHSRMPNILKRYLIPVIGCALIASPLPDELGVTLLAVSTMSARVFAAFSYVLNTAGILIILYIGTLL